MQRQTCLSVSYSLLECMASFFNSQLVYKL